MSSERLEIFAVVASARAGRGFWRSRASASLMAILVSQVEKRLLHHVFRYGMGLTATLAGIDKYFNDLPDWDSYVSPAASQLLPVSIPTFMGVVGIVEPAVGLAVLTRWPRAGAYVAGVWLVAIAANLALGGFYDVAVRDVVMAIGAFTLARLVEARQEVPVHQSTEAPQRIPRRATA